MTSELYRAVSVHCMTQLATIWSPFAMFHSFQSPLLW